MKTLRCPIAGAIVAVCWEYRTRLLAVARGLARDVDAYFINSSAFDVTGDGARERVRVVARYADRDVLRSGWLLGEKYLAGKIALAEVTLGQGRVVLFGFRPQHRGQTWGTFPFIWNAINLSAGK